MTLPAAVVDAFLDRVRLVVGEMLDAQSRPALLMSDERLCAEVLGISTKTLRTKLLPAGCPHLMVGGCRRYDVDAVLAWLKSQPTIER